MPNVLVVDDEDLMRFSLRQPLQEAGHTVVEACNAAEAVERFREGVDVVLLDYYLPDANGSDVVRKLREINPEPPIIFVTAQASIECAVDSMKGGAYYYAPKMIGLRGILLLVEKALETTRLAREVRILHERERVAYGVENLI